MAHLVRRQRRNPETGRTETYFLIQHRGRPAEALGFCSEKDAKDALQVAKAEIVQERRGVRPPRTSVVVSEAPPPVPTMLEWWGAEDLRKPSEAPSQMHRYVRAQGKEGNALRVIEDSRKVLIRVLGGLRLDEIDMAASDRLIVQLREEGLRSRSLQIRLGHLRMGLVAAVDYKRLKSVPTLRTVRLTDRKAHVFHTPDQARRLVDELRGRLERGYIDWPTFLAIVSDQTLGLRKGELLTRRWTDMDWGGAGMKIDDQPMPDGTTWRPKRDASRRTVPVPLPLLQLLREEWLRQGRSSGWIFPSPVDATKPRGDFRKALRNACKAAGLTELHPHALRHTWATAMIWNGASVRDIQGPGGWSSPAVPNAIYVHSTDERARALIASASPLADQGPLTSAADADQPTKERG